MWERFHTFRWALPKQMISFTPFYRTKGMFFSTVSYLQSTRNTLIYLHRLNHTRENKNKIFLCRHYQAAAPDTGPTQPKWTRNYRRFRCRGQCHFRRWESPSKRGYGGQRLSPPWYYHKKSLTLFLKPPPAASVTLAPRTSLSLRSPQHT